MSETEGKEPAAGGHGGSSISEVPASVTPHDNQMPIRASRGLKRSRGQQSNYIRASEIPVSKEEVPGWETMGKRQLKRAMKALQSNKIRAIKAKRREANNNTDADILYIRKDGDLKVGLPANFDYKPFKAILDKPPEERSVKLNVSARTRVRLAEAMETAPAVLLDCCPQYEEWMKYSERSSVALQVMRGYSTNRQAEKPLWYGVSGVSSELEGLLFDHGGHGWAVHCCREPLQAATPPPAQIGSRKLVYLSAEADTVLETVDADTAYIIGGLVDRNRHKGAAAARASELGIPTARLPLKDNLGLSDATVLTCLHVVQLLLRVWNGASWAEACAVTLPQRKIHAAQKGTSASTASTGSLAGTEDSHHTEVEEDEGSASKRPRAVDVAAAAAAGGAGAAASTDG